jgi:hypothetical protein
MESQLIKAKKIVNDGEPEVTNRNRPSISSFREDSFSSAGLIPEAMEEDEDEGEETKEGDALNLPP